MKAGIVIAMIWVLSGLNVSIKPQKPVLADYVRRYWKWGMCFDQFSGWGFLPGEREPAWRGSVTFGSAKSM